MHGYQSLTEREKQTLRLLLEGHDAKSMARHLGLSVHTINERLRDARRKFAVSSSKEAARLLRQVERIAPESIGDMAFGEARPASNREQPFQPGTKPQSQRPAAWAIGALVMIIVVAALSVLTIPEGSSPSVQTSTAATHAAESAVATAARTWLALVDQARWEQSLAGTGKAFRSLNTLEAWKSASEQARMPLGGVLSRTLLDEQDVPAPPSGYRMVRFRTDFVNKKGVIETVSLDREGSDWKVVGIYIG